jgi:pyruvate dehydrogenase E2 component (dihydrolipoamide acetyltransferase)
MDIRQRHGEAPEMQRELELPDVGEGIAEGEIVSWLVTPGDYVEEDEVLGEVETDKAVVDVPSPYEGTVVDLHAEEGDIVEVGSVIVTFEVDGSEADTTTESTEGTTTATDTPATEEESGSVQSHSEPAPTDAEPAAEESAGQHAADAATADTGEDTVAAATDVKVFAPPRVRRLARELDVNLNAIANANGDHPISETDVRRAAGELDSTAAGSSGQIVSEQPDQATTAEMTPEAQTTTDQSQSNMDMSTETTAATPTAGSADRSKTLAAPATRQLAREHGIDIDTVPTDAERDGIAFVTPDAIETLASNGATAETQQPEPTAQQQSKQNGQSSPARAEERIAYRGIRKAIGDNMEEAKYNAPHVSHHDSTEIERLVETRQMFNETTGDDVSITYLPFIIKAVIKALKDHPYMNSTLDKESGEIVLKEYYDIGIATATERGLVVPVLENADQKGIRELAQDISELTSRARNNDLSPDEMAGSTFTISNFGAIGGDYATPIINYPEAAILGLGAIKQRATVVDGEATAQHTLPLSLTVDHRLIDGAVAAQFTNDVKTYLNTPEMLML